MAIVSKRVTPRVDLHTQVSRGRIVADAVAAKTTTVTASVGQYLQLTAADLTGFRATDVVQITGSGTAGAKEVYQVQLIGTSGSSSTTKFDIRQLKPIVTAVSGALLELYYKISLPFFPDKFELINQTTLDKYLWVRGMAQNSVIKTTAAGVTSKLTDSGIFVTARAVYFHPSMVGVSEIATWSVEYPMPS